VRKVFWFLEDVLWNLRCKYNFWLHGPYGLSKVIEKIPFKYQIKYLRKYGATIGENCRFERGMNIHRPLGVKPFENLYIGNNVYLGHNTLLDLSRKIVLKDNVIIASRCQVWTHASDFKGNTLEDYIYSENFGDVVINEGAMIYSNVVITHGSIIGSFSKIGACSLVNKVILSNSFYGGVPARQIHS